MTTPLDGQFPIYVAGRAAYIPGDGSDIETPVTSVSRASVPVVSRTGTAWKHISALEETFIWSVCPLNLYLSFAADCVVTGAISLRVLVDGVVVGDPILLTSVSTAIDYAATFALAVDPASGRHLIAVQAKSTDGNAATITLTNALVSSHFLTHGPALGGPQGLRGLQGAPGAPGADSTVPGPKGDTGDASTVPGPKGDTGDPGLFSAPLANIPATGDTSAAGVAFDGFLVLLKGAGLMVADA